MKRSLSVTAFALTALAVLALWPTLPPGIQAQEKKQKLARQQELAALQGTWKCLRWEQNGKVMPDEDRQKVSSVVKGNKYKSTSDGIHFLEGNLVVDPTKTPHHLDSTFDGGVFRSIYVRAGNYVIFCNGPPNSARPTEFVSEPTLCVFKIER